MPVQGRWEAPKKASNFPAIPDGSYQAFIRDVTVIEDPTYDDKNVLEEKLKVEFEILEDVKFTDEMTECTTKGRKLWKKMRPVMSAAKEGKAEATFNKIYQAFFKRSPYDDQITMIDAVVVNSFIGKQGQLIIKRLKGDQGYYNKISDFLPAKTDLPLPRDFSIPPVKDVFDEMPSIDVDEV